MKQLIYLCFLVVVFISCSKEESTTIISEFETIKELKADVIKLPTTILLPRSIFITDDKLIIYKEKDSTLFDIFKLPECSLLFSAGEKGMGPNDFIYPDPRSFIPTEKGFLLLESGSSIIKQVEVSTNNLLIKGKTEIDNSHAMTNGLYLLKEDQFLSLGNINDENEYIIYNNNDSSFQKVGQYPDWDPSIKESFTRFTAYLKSCVVHPQKNKFASFYARFKRFRIYNTEGAILHDVEIRVPPYSEKIEADFNQRFVYYISTPQATENEIYALCSNRKEGDDLQKITNEIHKFDWNGKALVRYKLDKYISMFVLDEARQCIYGLDKNEGDKLYVFNLKK